MRKVVFLTALLFLCVLNSPLRAEEKAVEVDVQGAPVYGGNNARVSIVEFTDFECPFCGQVQPALKQVLNAYPEDVKLIFKSFPLGFHRYARQAHLAAMCAEEQGKFWDYRNILFSHQRALQKKDLLNYASQAGIEKTSFLQCLDTEKYASKIEADFQDGMKAGVMGTPTFFINGKPISGAVPFGVFDKIVQKELSRKS